MENISINDWLPYSEKSTLSHFVNRLLYLCLPDIYFELHLLKYIALEEYYSNYICLKRTLTHSMIVVQFTTGKLYYYYEKRQKSQAAFIWIILCWNIIKHNDIFSYIYFHIPCFESSQVALLNWILILQFPLDHYLIRLIFFKVFVNFMKLSLQYFYQILHTHYLHCITSTSQVAL